MRILFLSDDFPPKSFGGAGIITHNLALGIHRAGHEMYVITTVQDKSKEGWTEISEMKVYSMYSDYPQRLASYVSLYNINAVRRVARLIKEINPDVIHAHNVHNYLSYGCIRVARKFTEKVFLTTHDAMAFNYGKLVDFYDRKDLSVQKTFSYKVGFLQNLKTAKKRFNPIRNVFIKYYLNTYPRKVFAISNRLKDALNQNGLTNVVTIHYGIDVLEWNVTDQEKDMFVVEHNLRGKKVIFYGGRLSELKGGKVMIDTLRELVNLDRSVVLLLAGTSNGYSQYLLWLATSYGIEDNVIFTGWLSRDDVKKAYAASQVVVTPSLYFDAFNLFNIEAGAARKPVVGTCFGGTPEIVLDNETGIIVNPWNIPMMTKALDKLLHDDSYARNLGDSGRLRIEKEFTLRRYVSDTLDWYLK